jgi:hypothetical protein
MEVEARRANKATTQALQGYFSSSHFKRMFASRRHSRIGMACHFSLHRHT